MGVHQNLQLDDSMQRQVEQLAAARNTTPQESVRKAVEYYAMGFETRDELLEEAVAALADYRPAPDR